MTARSAVAHYSITAVLVVCVGLFAHFDAVRVSSEAVASHEAKQMAYWKGKLLPFYQRGQIVHEPNPKNWDELADPLFRLFEPLKSEPPASQGATK